ncbi:MAG: hypothetical protein IJS91_03890 [Bacteroidales bacterium]|nr:hypothetical protein [Bacteroidales bacterium]
MNRLITLFIITIIIIVSCDPQDPTNPSNKTKQQPEGAVDMGLSVLWHQCNVGASNPEDYGDYYAWGETETKSHYSWETYKFGTSFLSVSKYNTQSSRGTVDNKTTLDLEDDVARVKLGGTWRMPTNAEWKELRNTNNCTWTWTTQNGVYGRLVTSKKTGNSIFLPAAGYRDKGRLIDKGYIGFYWSSSLLEGSPYLARFVYFKADSVYTTIDYPNHYRSYGNSVRPVSE